MDFASSYHVPVLIQQVLQHLAGVEGVVVDATLGGGGYAEAVLEALPLTEVIGFDTDPNAIAFATERLSRFGSRFRIVEENFASLEESLYSIGVHAIHGIMYDLGISSNQIDTGSIGLSYRVESPLDMRLDPRLALSADTIVNEWEEEDLRSIFFELGEEPQSRGIARRIVEVRAKGRIMTTTELADVISKGIRPDKRSATLSRIFQAIRIEVNKELENLSTSLDQAVGLLPTGGRMVVVSYHSLEDRIVKEFMHRESAPASDPQSLEALRSSVDLSKARLKLLTKKPVVADQAEVERNPRARSAKLRAAEKV